MLNYYSKVFDEWKIKVIGRHGDVLFVCTKKTCEASGCVITLENNAPLVIKQYKEVYKF